MPIWKQIMDDLKYIKKSNRLPDMQKTQKLEAMMFTLSCQSYITDISVF